MSETLTMQLTRLMQRTTSTIRLDSINIIDKVKLLEEKELPWERKYLEDWSIIGMNHYKIDGTKVLFVAMEKSGRCIKEEGIDNKDLWDRLQEKAKRDR